MQKVKLNYHNGASRSKCSEPSTENCISGSMDRISWESLCFTVAIFVFLDGSAGAGCSVGCSHIFSSVLRVFAAWRQFKNICQGIEGIQVRRGRPCLNSHQCYHLSICLTERWWLHRCYQLLLNKSPQPAFLSLTSIPLFQDNPNVVPHCISRTER